MTKKRIVLDFDDTLTKSRNRIVELLNLKNGTTKTVYDVTDWNYISIDNKITPKQITDLYESQEFFTELKLHDGAEEFLNCFKDKYIFVICTVGTKKNLELKKQYCKSLFEKLNADYIFEGIEWNDMNDTYSKAKYDFSDIEWGIDDNSKNIYTLNTKNKILFAPYGENAFNRLRGNEENVYIVSSFKEIEEIISFFDNAEKEGIIFE